MSIKAKPTHSFLSLSFFLALFFFLSSCGNTPADTAASTDEVETASEEGTEPATTAEDGWIILFDGTSIDAWHNYNKEGVKGWIVEGDELVFPGKEEATERGDLTTNERFENFELRFEWKVSEGGNSGVMYNVVEDPKYRAPYETGPEYQLIDDDGYPGGVQPVHKSASNYDMHPANPNVTNAPGTYNEGKIIVNRGKVEHWLNGQKVVSYELWTPEWDQLVAASKWKDHPDYGQARSGHIVLQDHDDRISFKNIKIRKL